MRYLILILTAAACWGQTALFSTGGSPIAVPSWVAEINFTGSLQTFCQLNGGGIKCNQCGSVFIPSGGTKTLDTVFLAFGTVNKANGSTLRVGVQGVATGSGPNQPDGTWLAAGAAYADVSNAAAATSGSFWESPTIGGSLSLTAGDRACIVIEPDSYVSSDNFQLRSVNLRTGVSGIGQQFNGSTYSVGGTALHLLKFTDGSFGSIGMTAPIVAFPSVTSFNTGSTNDEIALKLIPNVDMRVTGFCSENWYSAAGGDVELVLYDSTSTVLEALAIDADQALTPANGTSACYYFAQKHVISAGSVYRAAVKPTTANNVRVVSISATSADYFAVYGGGTDVAYSARADAGSWTDTTTSRPLIWLLVDAVGGGSSGGSSGGAYVVAQ